MIRLLGILVIAGCTISPSTSDQIVGVLHDFMLTPAQRCQEARDILAGIPEPTVQEAALGAAACVQEQLQ